MLINEKIDSFVDDGALIVHVTHAVISFNPV